MVLDDAAHYLRERGLAGNHCTILAPVNGEASKGEIRMCNAKRDLEENRPESPATKLLVWSAADKNGLDRLAAAYADHFAHGEIDNDGVLAYLNDLAFTLSIRRSFLPWRSFVVADSIQTLKFLASDLSPAVRCIQNPRLGFIFTGQGAQWARMGSELLAYPTFQRSLRNAEVYFHELGAEWLLIGVYVFMLFKKPFFLTALRRTLKIGQRFADQYAVFESATLHSAANCPGRSLEDF